MCGVVALGCVSWRWPRCVPLEAFKISMGEVAELHEEFKQVDKDGSGDVSKDEFLFLLERILGVDLASHKDFLWREASDGKEHVSFLDFLEFHCQASARIAAEGTSAQKSDPHWDAFVAGVTLSSRSRSVGQSDGSSPARRGRRTGFFKTLTRRASYASESDEASASASKQA